jgi:hypothetical protein
MDKEPLHPGQVDLPEAPTPPRPAARSRNYALWSFIALFLAVLAVVAALFLRRQGDEEGPARRAVIQPAGETTETATPAPQPTGQDPRVAMHLERAKKYMRAGNWRSALFFLDQVLILNPTHPEAQQLMSTVERRMAAAGHAVKPRRRHVAPWAAVARAKKPPAKAAAPAPAPAKPEPPTEADVAFLSKPNSTVYLDGVLLGKTPLRDVSLSAGRHALKLVEDGHRPYVKEIEIKGGQKRTFEVQLQPVEVAAKPGPVATPAPKPAPAASAAAPAAKPAPSAASTEPPTLTLPRVIKVLAYKDGKKQKTMRKVFDMVEHVVSRATGRSAAGSTGPLRQFLYASNRDKVTPVTIYPLTMGYLIADAQRRGEGNIGAWLLFQHRNGRIKALAAKNWRPK